MARKREPMPVRGLKVTPEMAAQLRGDITGKARMPSPLKWAGSKGKPHYLGPLRDAMQSVGAQRHIDPMVGGANIALNMPSKETVVGDIDPYLVNAYEEMRDAPGGLDVPWHEFTGQGIPEGSFKGIGKPEEQYGLANKISKPTFFGPTYDYKGADVSHYEGPTLRGSTDNPEEGSLNYLLDSANRSELDEDGWKRLAQMWLMTQQASTNAYTRYNPEGRYTMTRGAEDGTPIVAFNNPSVADLYRDQGFKTMLNRRMDTAGTRSESRGIKPEMIALANIPDMDADRWFQHHPSKRFTGTMDDRFKWEDQFDEAFDPSDWLGKAAFFPDEIDPQGLIRRSIVNDLTELATTLTDTLEKAHFDRYTDGCFTEHDFFLFSHLMLDDLQKEDLISRVPRKGQELTAEEKAARMKTMDYPITGLEGGLTRFGKDDGFGMQDIHEMAGSKVGSGGSYPVSWTKKMPGPSFNTPTDFCQAGSEMRDREGTVCQDCNVHYAGRYGLPVVQEAMQRRYDRMMMNPQEWGRAMVSLLPGYSQMMQDENRRMMPLGATGYDDIDGNTGYMRWHDAGDLQGPQHLALLSDIARATPNINHWLPTKQFDHIKAYLAAGGEIPKNLTLRASMPDVGMGAKLPKSIEHPQVKTSTVGRSQIDPNYEGYVCPASKAGSGGWVDEECNACWRSDIDNIDYEFENPNAKPGVGRKGTLPILDRLSTARQKEYEKLNPPIPTDPEGFAAFSATPEGKAAIDAMLGRNP